MHVYFGIKGISFLDFRAHAIFLRKCIIDINENVGSDNYDNLFNVEKASTLRRKLEGYT